MNIQAEKLDLLQTIMNTNDEGLIMDVKAFLSNRKADWFDELNEYQQKDVLEGLARQTVVKPFLMPKLLKCLANGV